MKSKLIGTVTILVLSLLYFNSCTDKTDSLTDNSAKSISKKSVSAVVSVFATGFNSPRGLKFGPDGYLYVAEAGNGGYLSTVGQCDQVIPPIGPYLGGYTARISKVNSSGTVTTVADNLPSSQTATHDLLGVSDVAFMNGSLYALLAGAGCSHGHSDYPASIIKVNSDGSWSVFADLSSWQQNHPVAHPEEEDFEPDGTWYSLLNVRNNFYAIEPNHGEMVKVTPGGDVSRVIDFSAFYGHKVPTSMAFHGNFYVGNLNTFPTIAGSSNIFKVTPGGQSKISETGFTTVLGVAFDNQDVMYVLEAYSIDGFPTPAASNTGRIIRVLPSGQKETLVDGLNFPTAMTYGPDGALYVSNKGFSFAPGSGEILKITLN